MTIPYASVVRWIGHFQEVVAENKEYLTSLDSAIGDGDHGINMDRGMRAVMTKIEGLPEGDIGTLLRTVGMALVSSVGGAGGPLYGTLFMQMGAATKGKPEITLNDWADAVDAALKGVQSRGKAEPGDKTMVDALGPAAEALRAAAGNGTELDAALKSSTEAAREGMEATTPLVARKGRASYLGERSAGHQDPGATSSYLLIRCAEEAFSNQN
ncbi:MAG TPA: dihydroxyacetone kinase subunit DhaL [Actinomycetota bacterium]|nr:dihydroxyacetone kinase subunit DhaL [Actinomycetota bacterium]